MTDLSELTLCCVVGCAHEVCEPGEDCGRHGTICRTCKQECTPYRARVGFETKPYWACDNCDRELPGYEP